MAGDPLSVRLAFDCSVRYGPDNASPRSAAIGYVATAGSPLLVGSRQLSAFVSSTHAEFRALVEGAQAVAALGRHRRISDLHVRGDAAAVIEAVDPERPGSPGDRIRRRRVGLVRDAVAPIPRVTYRRVDRQRNERAHRLATRGHDA